MPTYEPEHRSRVCSSHAVVMTRSHNHVPRVLHDLTCMPTRSRGFTLIGNDGKGLPAPCNPGHRCVNPRSRGFTLMGKTSKGLPAPCNPGHRCVNPRSRGFTLIEVMVVVVILGLLAAIVVPKVMSRPDEARAVAAKADISAINQALKLYRLDNISYPTTEQGLSALVQRPTTSPIPNNWKPGGYLERLPKDPWGRDYQYLNPGVRGEIDVFSLGADGQPGGDGPNADVFN